MAVAPGDLAFDSIRGTAYPLRDWLTSYPMLMVALDPYTSESSWILDTADDLLHHYAPADIRVAWLVAADDDGCKEFLGPLAEKYLTFADPDRTAIAGLGIERLPALVAVRPDLALQVSNGWTPEEWKAIATELATMLRWNAPLVPKPGDPLPYAGTPAGA